MIYMNTKTTKFLAVLAVLAFAFAAFAIAAPADVSDATGESTWKATDDMSELTLGTDVKTDAKSGDKLEAGKAYYIKSNMTLTMPDAGENTASPALIFLEKEVVVTLNAQKEIAEAKSTMVCVFGVIGTTTGEVTKLALHSDYQSSLGTYWNDNGKLKISTIAAIGENAVANQKVWCGSTAGGMKTEVYEGSDKITYIGQSTTDWNWTSTFGAFYGQNPSVKCCNSSETELDLVNFTGVITDETSTNVAKLTGFTGVLKVTKGSTFMVDTWTAGDLEITKGTVTAANSSAISLKGKLTIDANTTFDAAGKSFTGAGSVEVYGTLDNGAPSNVNVLVNVYDGGSWVGVIEPATSNSADLALSYSDVTAGSKILSSKTTVTSGETSTVTSVISIYEDVILVKNEWMQNTSIEQITLYSAAMTINGAAIVGAKDVVTLDEDSEVVLDTSGSITNNGTINFATLAQVVPITNSATGKVLVAGVEIPTVTGDAASINAATEAGKNVNANITSVITDEIKIADSEAVLTFTTNAQTALNITMSDAGELRMVADVALTGTITVGSQKAITLDGIKGDFTITKGSVVMAGVEITGGSIVVPEDVTYIIDGLTLAENAALTITLNDNSKLVFRNDVIIAGNSVNINVADGKSAKVLVEEDATISYDLIMLKGGNLTIGAAATDDIKTTVEGEIAMMDGKYLTIYGTMNLYSEITGSVVNNGTLNLYTGADISNATITGDGEIKDKSSESEMEDLIFTGESAQGYITYTANQNVIVKGTWTLVKGAFITIKGSLNVPADCRLVIEPGASLTIDNKIAVANIDGTIVIEDADSGKDNAAIFTVMAGTVYISGTATVNGIMYVPGTAANQPASVIVLAGGALNLAKTGALTVGDNGSITVLSASSFTVQGALNATNIYNYGTVTINTSVPASGSSTIFMAAGDAVVDIVKFTVDQNNYTLTISDSGLLYYTDKSGDSPVYYSVGATGISKFTTYVNSIVIGGGISGVTSSDYYAVVTGIEIAEKVTSKDVETYKSTTHGYIAPLGKAYTNTMLIDGEINVSMSYVGTGAASPDAYATAKVTTDGDETIEIASGETVYVGFSVELENTGTLKVSGTLDADDTSVTQTRAPTFTNNGTMTMAGSGIATRAVYQIAGTVNGAHIEVGTTPIHTYVTVDTVLAMASADPTIDDITLLGKNTMSKTATLPKDVVMTLSSATLTIGSSAGADVTLTIAENATLKGNGTITVNGTMYAYDQTDVKGNTIISDVKKVEVNEAGKVVKNGWALWTNIVTAINTAAPGDIITIAKENTGDVYVTISADAEIKEGVTVIVPEGVAPLFLKDGVTLTISGELSTQEDIFAQTKFDKTARNITGDDGKASAIVVKGLLLLPDANKYSDTYKTSTATVGTDYSKLSAGAPISGAYCKSDENYAIASIEVAMDNVDVIIGKIVLNGTLSDDAATFVATDDCSVLEIGEPINANYPTEISIDTLVLDGATFQNVDDGVFAGIITNLDGSVATYGMKGAFVIKDKSDKLTLGGAMTAVDKKTIAIYSGAVYTASGLTITTSEKYPLYVASDAELTVSDGTALVDYAVVNGTLSVDNACALTVNNDLTVYGSVEVASATTSKGAGTLSITKLMFIGMAADDLTDSAAYIPTAAGASLSGAFACADGAVFIAAGSTVDEVAQKALDEMKYYVTIEVEGSEWFTVYTNDANEVVKVYTVPVENAQFVTLYDGITALATAVDGSKIYVPVDIEAYSGKILEAYVKYAIYTVKIYTDTGVKSVAIDGVELKTDGGKNWFETVTKLVAGPHKVTYTLKDGYEGTPALYTMDHTILKDMSFTVDSVAGLNYEFQLAGTEPIPEPEPTPTPTPEKESEWNVTTILLLVLVILIAIMAVIVALRLNRN